MPTRTQANSYLIPTLTLTKSYLQPTRTQTMSYPIPTRTQAWKCSHGYALSHMKLEKSWVPVNSYMGGATDFKVGVQYRIRERSERKKKFVPPLFQMWGYKQANISRGLLNILKFAVWLLH